VNEKCWGGTVVALKDGTFLRTICLIRGHNLSGRDISKTDLLVEKGGGVALNIIGGSLWVRGNRSAGDHYLRMGLSGCPPWDKEGGQDLDVWVEIQRHVEKSLNWRWLC